MKAFVREALWCGTCRRECRNMSSAAVERHWQQGEEAYRGLTG